MPLRPARLEEGGRGRTCLGAEAAGSGSQSAPVVGEREGGDTVSATVVALLASREASTPDGRRPGLPIVMPQLVGVVPVRVVGDDVHPPSTRLTAIGKRS